MASSDAAGEAALEWGTREIDTPDELDRAGLDAVTYLEDVAYAFKRRADMVSETWIHPRVVDRWEHVAATLRHAAAYADEAIGYPLVMSRPR